MNLLCRDKNHYSHTVAALFMYLKILKMGLTALFTHLKIILLQCFQFLVSTKISSIQTDPKRTFGNHLPCLVLYTEDLQILFCLRKELINYHPITNMKQPAQLPKKKKPSQAKPKLFV